MPSADPSGWAGMLKDRRSTICATLGDRSCAPTRTGTAAMSDRNVTVESPEKAIARDVRMLKPQTPSFAGVSCAGRGGLALPLI